MERIDSIPDWMWEMDLDGVLIYSNRVVKDMLGYSVRSIIGKKIFDLMVPEDTGKCWDIFRTAISSKEPIENIITHLKAKDSSVRTVEVSCEQMLDDEGRLVGFRGVTVDITDMLSRHQRTQEIYSTYEAVVEYSQTGIFIIQNGLLIYVNPRICELMGYTKDEILGTPIWKYVHPDDLSWLVEYNRRRIAGESAPEQYVARGITKSGEVRSFDFRARLIQFKGEPAILLNAIDITDSIRAQEALRKSEREYRDLVEKTSDWVWQVDENNIYTYASPRSRDLLGYGPEEMVGKSPFDFMPPDEAESVAEIFTPIIDNRQPFTLLENTLVHRDGHLVVVESNGEPVYDDEGVFRGYRGTDRDITERKRSEEDLRQSREMLQLVMNSIPQYVFWKDTNSRYVGCNEIFARDAGVGSREEIIGKTDYDLVWGETNADSYREWDRKVMEADKPEYHIIEPQLTADGKHRLVDTNKVPLHDAEGKVVGILGTVEDITERKQAEQALQEAEAKYRSLVEETMVGVFMIQDDTFVYVNPRMLEIFGTASDEMLEKPPLAFVAPEDHALVAENIRKLLNQEVKSLRYGFTALRIDGVPIDVEVQTTITSFLGRPAIIGSLIDITERKRYMEALQDNEERYRQLFEHSPDMVLLILAKTWTFIALNPAVTRVLGYAPSDVLGKHPWDFSPEFQPSGERTKDMAERLIHELADAPIQHLEYVVQHKDGSFVDCEISLVVYKFHGEDLVQAIIRDVTERKQAAKLERDLEAQKRSFYRETIFSVTGGTLDICDADSVEPYVAKARALVEADSAAEVSVARHEVKQFCENHGLVGERLDVFLTAVGEAITNAIKHGMHGKIFAGEDATSVWIAVCDEGSGIESLILPRAVLLRGFSTKPSLGLGYSIMLEACDRILLATDEEGTTVVLVKEKNEPEPGVSIDQLPDTWNNVPA